VTIVALQSRPAYRLVGAGPALRTPLPPPLRCDDDRDTSADALALLSGSLLRLSRAAALRAAGAVLFDTPGRIRTDVLAPGHPARTIADTSCIADVLQHCSYRTMRHHPRSTLLRAPPPMRARRSPQLHAC
jgi:hypothetical protein